MQMAVLHGGRGDVITDMARRLIGEHTVALVLAGSTVHGNATPYSDVDLAHIVDTGYSGPDKRFYYHGGVLVSVNWRTLTWWRRAVEQPEKAIFI